MPTFDFVGVALDIPRNVAFLDTNVLVAHQLPADQDHDQAEAFLETVDYELLVTPPVLVESCGMLTSRSGRKNAVGRFLSWLLTPGHNVRLFPAPHSPLDVSIVLNSHAFWMRQFNIDYVDAYLMEAAHRLTETLSLMPYLPICTFDTKDFFRCWRKGYLYSVFDMRSLELVD
jgi:predicted nucleic acid-binding protein